MTPKLISGTNVDHKNAAYTVCARLLANARLHALPESGKSQMTAHTSRGVVERRICTLKFSFKTDLSWNTVL